MQFFPLFCDCVERRVRDQDICLNGSVTWGLNLLPGKSVVKLLLQPLGNGAGSEIWDHLWLHLCLFWVSFEVGRQIWTLISLLCLLLGKDVLWINALCKPERTAPGLGWGCWHFLGKSISHDLFLLAGIHTAQGELQTEAQADGPGRL